MDINVGDVLKLKKQHPCGSREWEVLRVGADFRLKCLGCGHQIMIARKLLEKNVNEPVNSYIEHIEKKADYLKKLVDDLYLLFWSEAIESEVDMKSVNITEVVTSLL